MIATAAKLLCPECQRENESERVYCHDCGARLDRSAVAPTKEPPKDTHKRLKKFFDPQRARLRFLFFTSSKMILGAAALAIVIQMLLPPDVPQPTKTLVLASQVRLDMEGALQHHQPAQLDFSEDQVNAYLAASLKTKQAALDKPFIDFKRAVAVFHEDLCLLTVERAVYGFSLYSSIGYSVRVTEGKLVATPKAGYIGRMPLHPQLMEAGNIIFADVWSALDRDAKLVRKFAAINFHDKHAVLSVVAP